MTDSTTLPYKEKQAITSQTKQSKIARDL
jgi:hypothetical protein